MAKIKLNDLIDSWTLGIDSTADVVDMKIYNKFKFLFDDNATVDDDFNVLYRYDPKKRSGSYGIKPADRSKSFDLYAHDIALQVISIVIDSVKILDSDTRDRKNMTFTIKRRIEVRKKRQYVLPGAYTDDVLSNRTIEFEDKKDSLQMATALRTKISMNQEAVYMFSSVNTIRVTMALETDTVKITGIKSITNAISCTNDADNDAVLNQEDSLQNQYGDFSANGMADYDLDGIPDKNDRCKLTYGEEKNQGCPHAYFLTKNKFDGFIGLQLNSAKINLPELNQLGYRDASGNNATDVLQSKKGSLKSSGLAPGIYAGANFTYYFGQKRKRSGITAGFNYTGFTAQYLLTSPAVYTFKSFDGFHFYRRQIIMDSLHERIHYNVFNVPFLFTYRVHLNRRDKLLLNLKAGPSLMVFSNTSNYNADISFGGLYQIDTIQKNKITYYDYFSQGSTYNVFLTAGNINAQNQNPGAARVFEQLAAKNYDFASNKHYTGMQKLKRMTVALNIDITLQYKVSEGLTIKAGPQFVYAPALPGKDKYRPVDKTTDAYRSLYDSNAKPGYSAFGLHAGFVYNY